MENSVLGLGDDSKTGVWLLGGWCLHVTAHRELIKTH